MDGIQTYIDRNYSAEFKQSIIGYIWETIDNNVLCQVTLNFVVTCDPISLKYIRANAAISSKILQNFSKQLFRMSRRLHRQAKSYRGA